MSEQVQPNRVEGIELRGIFAASDGWKATYSDLSGSNWERVPIVAWGVDLFGEIRPLTRVGPGVLKVLQDEVGKQHVRIIAPDDMCVDDRDEDAVPASRDGYPLDRRPKIEAAE